jgi:hypothetical protein
MRGNSEPRMSLRTSGLRWLQPYAGRISFSTAVNRRLRLPASAGVEIAEINVAGYNFHSLSGFNPARTRSM